MTKTPKLYRFFRMSDGGVYQSDLPCSRVNAADAYNATNGRTARVVSSWN